MIKSVIQKILIVSAALLLFSCSQDSVVTVPTFTASSQLTSALPVPSASLRTMNGVYDVLEGTDRLGKLVVVKQSGQTLSIFTGKNAGLFVLRAGHLDSAIILEGYWRYTQGTETGMARFTLPSASGGADILKGTFSASFQLAGLLGDTNDEPTIPVVLRFNRPLADSTFAIVAHRGGGRNSDRLPASENSIGIIQRAEQFGANGIEIDVRLTKDGVPILFHDENFSPRLVTGDYLIGPVSNFTFAAIRTLGTLKNGERIPTLREALDVVLQKTTLSLVWLDIKTPDAIPALAAIQQEYKLTALSLGRNVEILLGLSNDDLMERYITEHLVSVSPALCELSISDVQKVNARVWAPRWTLGPLPGSADQMRGEGRRTIIWTLDQREFILPFLQDGKIDGILTNYPSLVAFEVHALQ